LGVIRQAAVDFKVEPISGYEVVDSVGQQSVDTDAMHIDSEAMPIDSANKGYCNGVCPRFPIFEPLTKYEQNLFLRIC